MRRVTDEDCRIVQMVRQSDGWLQIETLTRPEITETWRTLKVRLTAQELIALVATEVRHD